MKKSILALAAAAILGFAGTSFAQSSASSSGSIGYHEAAVITLAPYATNSQYLDFGTLVKQVQGNVAWAKIYGVWDAPNPYAGANLNNFMQLNSAGDIPHTSQWHVTGEPNSAYYITVNGGNKLDLVATPDNLFVQFNIHFMADGDVAAPAPANSPAMLDGTGVGNFCVGGILTAAAGYLPATGNFSAGFPVQVNY